MKQGKRPPSFDASPGAVPIGGSRASHGSDTLRSPYKVSQELSSLHEEECKEEVAARNAATSVKINGFSNAAVVNNSDAAEETSGFSNVAAGNRSDAAEDRAVQGQENLPVSEPIYAEVYTPYSPEQKRWHERPLYRAVMVGGCLLATLAVVGIVLAVVFVTLPRPTGDTSPPTLLPSTTTPTSSPVTLGPSLVPTSSLTPEEIACEFIGHPSLADCRTTLSFNRFNGGDSTTGTIIPSEIGL